VQERSVSRLPGTLFVFVVQEGTAVTFGTLVDSRRADIDECGGRVSLDRCRAIKANRGEVGRLTTPPRYCVNVVVYAPWSLCTVVVVRPSRYATLSSLAVTQLRQLAVMSTRLRRK
jgi:hypothetical protein